MLGMSRSEANPKSRRSVARRDAGPCALEERELPWRLQPHCCSTCEQLVHTLDTGHRQGGDAVGLAVGTDQRTRLDGQGFGRHGPLHATPCHCAVGRPLSPPPSPPSPRLLSRLPLRASSPTSLPAPDPLPVHSPSHSLDSPSLQRGTTRVSSSCAAVSSTIRSYGRALWASLMSCPRPPSHSPTTVAPATCSCGPKPELLSPAAPGRRRGLLSADWLATDWLGHSAF